jgi:ribosomal protein S18 acetylase RimI-like enzyme
MMLEMRTASEADLKEISRWFANRVELKVWGGPAMSYPIRFNRFKTEIQWGIADSYAFGAGTQILGFAQLFDRFGFNHIARVLIKPQARGKGWGLKLLIELMQAAPRPNHGFSLFVHESNDAAQKLYEKLGFGLHPPPKQRPFRQGYVFMVKSPTV